MWIFKSPCTTQFAQKNLLERGGGGGGGLTEWCFVAQTPSWALCRAVCLFVYFMCVWVCVSVCVCVHAHASVCHKQLLLQCLGLRVLSDVSVSVKCFIYSKLLIVLKAHEKSPKCWNGGECSEQCADFPLDIIENSCTVTQVKTAQ